MTNKLNAQGGKLHAGEDLLICQYDMGDVDTIPFPFPADSEYWTKETWTNALRRALFDARECGQIEDRSQVELPDGTMFDID